MASELNIHPQRLASLDPDTGARPSSRIGNAANARTLVQRLKGEDETRMWRYTKIQGLMDGNPPWNAKKLEDIGQGHRANFNLRESEGIVEAAKTPYYDLVFEVPYFAEICFSVEGAEAHVVDQWGKTLTEEYSDLLSDWDGFDHEMQLQQWQMIVNGVGPLFWPHFVSWHSQAIKCRKVLVPMETKANVDELELCVVLHSYRADELESFISHSGTSEPDGEGWNIPLCKEAIIQSAMREMRNEWGMENYDLYQRAIRTGDLFYGIHRSDRIYVASIFVKEFGGKVSHYMITDTALGSTPTYELPSEEVGYIFKRRRKFDSFSNVLCPFFFDSGPDGTWHAIKGLGPKIYDFCDISNRTFCQMLDGAVIGSGITLETQDANSLEETQIALIGGASVVSPGYKVAQTRIAEALDGAMAVRRELHGTLQANTGSYRQRTDEGNRPEPTLGQAQLVFQQQGALTKGSTNRYYANMDKWHRETLRRILDPAQSSSVPGGKEAIALKERCKARGIPPEILSFKNIKRIIATRSIGYGSPQLRDVTTRELVGLIPFMDEVSRNHALRARAASLPGVGMYSVDSFFPPIEKAGVPNAHTSFAMMENNALRNLDGKVLVEPQQNHSIHFDTHMADAVGHLQEPNASPMDKLRHFNQAGPHMAQHLQLLKGDPTRKEEYKKKENDLQQLGKVTDQLTQQIQESMQAQMKQQGNGQQQQQQAPDPKMVKVAGDLSLKAKKEQFSEGLKTRKQTHAEQLADKKAAAAIQRETAKTQAAMQKTGADMGMARAKAEQSLNVEQAKTRHGLAVEQTKTRAGLALAERKAQADAILKAKQAAQREREKKPEKNE